MRAFSCALGLAYCRWRPERRHHRCRRGHPIGLLNRSPCRLLCCGFTCEFIYHRHSNRHHHRHILKNKNPSIPIWTLPTNNNPDNEKREVICQPLILPQSRHWPCNGRSPHRGIPRKNHSSRMCLFSACSSHRNGPVVRMGRAAGAPRAVGSSSDAQTLGSTCIQ